MPCKDPPFHIRNNSPGLRGRPSVHNDPPPPIWLLMDWVPGASARNPVITNTFYNHNHVAHPAGHILVPSFIFLETVWLESDVSVHPLEAQVTANVSSQSDPCQAQEFEWAPVQGGGG